MSAVIRIDRKWPGGLALVFGLAGLAGCAARLGPGYTLRRETVTVHYADRAVEPAVYCSLQVVARNSGNRPLALLEIRAPQRPRPTTGSAPASSAETSAGKLGPNGQQKDLPVTLEPPLRQGRSRQIFFRYSVPVPGGMVFLEPQEWFPSFLPPEGLFARWERRAPTTVIDIFVPGGYRVLTSGQLRRTHAGRSGAQTEYVYEIHRRDFQPFLLIGKYGERRLRAGGREVLFWTRRPLESACAQSVAEEAAKTAALYRSIFGKIGSDARPLRVIEIAPGNPSLSDESNRKSVPNGVLFSANPEDICREGNRFFYLSARSLAATWFGWTVRPEPGARAILGDGAQDYAALIAEEKLEGAGTRKQQIRSWLAEYDRLSSGTEPLPPANLGPHPTGGQREMAGIQSALFFVALEDRFGEEKIRRALRELVRSLGGATAGQDELRSALEWNTGENLYDFFQRWLERAEIPTAFRQRYRAEAPKPELGTEPALQARRRK